MGDYRDVPVKVATTSDPANTYMFYDTRVKDNMIAMDRKANRMDDDSFNTMLMLVMMKKHSTKRTYPIMRNKFIKHL